MSRGLLVLSGALIFLSLDVLLLLYGIKIMKRQKSAVENFEFHEQFSSKEPHSILLFNVSWFAICFGLSFSIVANRKFYFSEVDFNIKAVVSLLLLIFGALYFVLKIFTHWHKKIEVNVVQLTYTDGIGREYKFSAQQITSFSVSPRYHTLKIYFVDEIGKKRRCVMGVYWEPSLMLCEWKERYLIKNRFWQTDVSANIDNSPMLVNKESQQSSAQDVAKSPALKSLKNATTDRAPWWYAFIGGGVIGIVFSIGGVQVGGLHYDFSMGLGGKWATFGRTVGLVVSGICLFIGCTLYFAEKYKKAPKINHKSSNYFMENEPQQTKNSVSGIAAKQKNKSLLCLVLGSLSLLSGILLLPYWLFLPIVFLGDKLDGVKETIFAVVVFFLPLAVSMIITISTGLLTVFASKPRDSKYIVGVVLSFIGLVINIIFLVWLFRVGIYIT